MTAILKKPLDVLLIEDRPEDAKLILRELELGGFAVNHVRVTTGAEMRNALVRPGRPASLVSGQAGNIRSRQIAKQRKRQRILFHPR